MRILIINLYYKPETGGHFYSNIAENWSKEGHEVNILSCRPYLNELGEQKNVAFDDIEGVKVYRLPINILSQKIVFFKAINLLKFCFLALLWALKKPKYDLVMTSSLTPLFMAVVCRLICKIKGSNFLYRIMDIHPNVWKYSGSFKNSWILNILEHIEKSNCRAANQIVTLSEDMAKTIQDRDFGHKLPINIIHDGLPNRSESGMINFIEEINLKKKFRIVYTGNIGRFQKLETIIDVFHKIPESESIELIIVGRGLQKEFLKKRAGYLLNKTIKFVEFQNTVTLNSIIQTADLGLVSLLEGVETCAYPSKMFNYLDQGCPILALMNDCYLTRFIRENGVGYSLTHYDLDEISRRIIELSHEEGLKESKVDNINKVIERNTNQSIIKQWSKLIEAI